MDWLNLIVFPVIRVLLLIFVVMTGAAYLTWFERKLIGRFQIRYGPNRAGPFGLLQPLADAIKAFFKEEVIPHHVDKAIYLLAPALGLVPALLIWAVVPIAKGTAAIADVNIGFLWILAIAGIESYSIILAGWSSNNNYSLLGALRSSAQMLSYELPMGLFLVSCGCGLCSHSSLSAFWPRRTAAPSTCPKPKTSWWLAIRPSMVA
jgi:NADH-quinone oxidoreductase subunit H